MRLFIAINFDEQVKKNIICVQERLKKLGRCSTSRPENLHLTLVFLGEIAKENVEAVKCVMDQITVPVLHLTFDRVDCFNRHDGGIWWLGSRHDKALFMLQKELADRLRDEGFHLDNRRYNPHITLARRSDFYEKADKNKLLGRPFAAIADTVSLMLSEQIKGKLTYTQLYAVHVE